MSDDRVSGLALIAGSLGFLITMSIHPMGPDFFVPGGFEHASHLGIVAHSLGLACLPISFLGAFGLSRCLSSQDQFSIAVGSSVAVLFWSLAMLRGAVLSRGIAVYGYVLGPLSILALASGHLQLGVHGFGLIVICQAIWFIPVGASLSRRESE
jgi:hypothetical protein